MKFLPFATKELSRALIRCALHFSTEPYIFREIQIRGGTRPNPPDRRIRQYVVISSRDSLKSNSIRRMAASNGGAYSNGVYCAMTPPLSLSLSSEALNISKFFPSTTYFHIDWYSKFIIHNWWNIFKRRVWINWNFNWHVNRWQKCYVGLNM